MEKFGVITVEDFKKAVDMFGFDSPVITAIWNDYITCRNAGNEDTNR